MAFYYTFGETYSGKNVALPEMQVSVIYLEQIGKLTFGDSVFDSHLTTHWYHASYILTLPYHTRQNINMAFLLHLRCSSLYVPIYLWYSLIVMLDLLLIMILSLITDCTHTFRKVLGNIYIRYWRIWWCSCTCNVFSYCYSKLRCWYFPFSHVRVRLFNQVALTSYSSVIPSPILWIRTLYYVIYITMSIYIYTPILSRYLRKAVRSILIIPYLFLNDMNDDKWY